MRLALVALLLAPVSATAANACWDAADVLGVFAQCRKGGGSPEDCLCYVRALQKTSPDPETRSTFAEQKEAANSCGMNVEEVETKPKPKAAEGQADL